ncbi:DUF2235 domain-containing protein [Pseudohongiella spirulinae]|uniref:T6SS Phospholipase effector Tle1-like catalytic domain-containing protein n=1 Tax=Pseudohongiella spirulinae TaxID=1249552 RepID=A0A0S2KE51_9GAMM|nr:DUF2235 domain-containing protein [Pseudohongiella spirulinae]ALO46398.1 hypothetical protein PS2015_1747 [Pseudohongiella spirulinae]
MRKLVMGFDGTWNTPDQMDRDRQVPTNVVKLLRALQSGAGLLKYYDTGVGTVGRLDRLWGGAAGRGLFANVRDGWLWLSRHYRPGDRVYLFGFSRGAYTARSLAGMLAICGIGPGEGAAQSLADEACRIYRERDPDKRGRMGARFVHEHHCRPGTVDMLGVWDTVGAMGLPTRGPLGQVTRRRHGFHNVRLGANIRHAYHALALNEQRAAFTPSLWQHPVPPTVQTVQQMWFAGVHSNIGGGYACAGLSDIALQWMLSRAESHGLALNQSYVKRRIDPDVFGELRDSLSMLYRTPLAGGPRPRAVGTGVPGEAVHLSAWQRWRAVSRPDEAPW